MLVTSKCRNKKPLTRYRKSERYSYQIRPKFKPTRKVTAKLVCSIYTQVRCLVNSKHNTSRFAFCVRKVQIWQSVHRQIICVHGPTVCFRCQKFDNAHLWQPENRKTKCYSWEYKIFTTLEYEIVRHMQNLYAIGNQLHNWREYRHPSLKQMRLNVFKLTVLQSNLVAQEFPWKLGGHSACHAIDRLYRTQMSITLFTKSRNWYLSKISFIQSTTSYHVRLRQVLILFSHPPLSLLRGFFP